MINQKSVVLYLLATYSAAIGKQRNAFLSVTKQNSDYLQLTVSKLKKHLLTSKLM